MIVKKLPDWFKMPICVVYHTAPGQPNLQIGLGVPSDLVRFECVVLGGFAALQKCEELGLRYAPTPKHMSGYHYVTASQWCEYWLAQAHSGYQFSLFGD